MLARSTGISLYLKTQSPISLSLKSQSPKNKQCALNGAEDFCSQLDSLREFYKNNHHKHYKTINHSLTSFIAMLAKHEQWLFSYNNLDKSIENSLSNFTKGITNDLKLFISNLNNINDTDESDINKKTLTYLAATSKRIKLSANKMSRIEKHLLDETVALTLDIAKDIKIKDEIIGNIEIGTVAGVSDFVSESKKFLLAQAEEPRQINVNHTKTAEHFKDLVTAVKIFHDKVNLKLNSQQLDSLFLEEESFDEARIVLINTIESGYSYYLKGSQERNIPNSKNVLLLEIYRPDKENIILSSQLPPNLENITLHVRKSTDQNKNHLFNELIALARKQKKTDNSMIRKELDLPCLRNYFKQQLLLPRLQKLAERPYNIKYKEVANALLDLVQIEAKNLNSKQELSELSNTLNLVNKTIKNPNYTNFLQCLEEAHTYIKKAKWRYKTQEAQMAVNEFYKKTAGWLLRLASLVVMTAFILAGASLIVALGLSSGGLLPMLTTSVIMSTCCFTANKLRQKINAYASELFYKDRQDLKIFKTKRKNLNKEVLELQVIVNQKAKMEKTQKQGKILLKATQPTTNETKISIEDFEVESAPAIILQQIYDEYLNKYFFIAYWREANDGKVVSKKLTLKELKTAFNFKINPNNWSLPNDLLIDNIDDQNFIGNIQASLHIPGLFKKAPPKVAATPTAVTAYSHSHNPSSEKN